MKTVEALIQITLVVGPNQAGPLVQSKINRVYYEMYQERVQQALRNQKGFGGAVVNDAVKSWQGQQRVQNDVIFHTPPRLGTQQKTTYQDDQQQQHPATNLSTASSSRSDLPSTLANRLKNKGEMLASKNQSKPSESSYVPSIMSKDQMSIRGSQLRGNRSGEKDVSSQPSDEEEGHYSQKMFQEKTTKRVISTSAQNYEEAVPKQAMKKSTPVEYEDTDRRDPTATSKPFRIVKNQNFKQMDENDEDYIQVQKVSGSTYSKPFQKRNHQSAVAHEQVYTQPTYLSEAELEELANPDQVAKTLLNELKSDDWQRQFEAINNFRRLTRHHPAVLKKYNFNGMMVELVKLIENLRSGVSKNSLMTMLETSQAFRRDLDPYLDTAMSRLVKKSIDSNSFIADEVRRVMVALTANCTEQKSVAILQSIYQSKAIQVRLNVAYCIVNLLQKIAETSRTKTPEFERLFQIMSVYVVDQTAEVRQVSRECLHMLVEILGKSPVDALVSRLAPEKDALKIRQTIDKGRTEATTPIEFKRFVSVAEEPRLTGKTPDIKPKPRDETQQTTQTFKKATTPQQPTKMTSTAKGFQQVRLKDPAEFEELASMLTQAEESEWKNRIEAANQLTNLAMKHPGHLCQHKLCNKFLDSFVKLINDSNIKVAIQASQQLLDLVPSLTPGIQQNATNVWNGVFQALSSNNAQVKQSAELIFQSLCEELDANYSIQQVCQNILYGPQKSKALALGILTDLAGQLYETRPSVFVKYVMPMISKTLDETKPDIKGATAQFVKVLREICPEDLKANVPASKLQSILK